MTLDELVEYRSVTKTMRSLVSLSNSNQAPISVKKVNDLFDTIDDLAKRLYEATEEIKKLKGL